MKPTGQLHVLGALTMGKELPVSDRHEAEWDTDCLNDVEKIDNSYLADSLTYMIVPFGTSWWIALPSCTKQTLKILSNLKYLASDA